jgi:hypothetical protein
MVGSRLGYADEERNPVLGILSSAVQGGVALHSNFPFLCAKLSAACVKLSATCQLVHNGLLP